MWRGPPPAVKVRGWGVEVGVGGVGGGACDWRELKGERVRG